MKKAVYLDSTIPSYLFDRRESLETYTAITKQWWEQEGENHRVFVSGETVAETSRGDHPYRRDIMRFVSRLALLPYDEQLDQIVEVYIANHLMPRSLTGDSLHLAYASLYKMDFLLTWNCNHLANANKRQHIRVINTRLGLFIPEITTPMELFTETTS